MDEQVISLLRKYLSDRCTPEELVQVRTILRSDRYEEEWATVLQKDAERIINNGAPHVLGADKAAKLLNRVIKSADIDDSKEVRQSSGRWWYAAAASILLFITAGLTFFTISSVWEVGSVTEAVTTEEGQAEVLLPDGTRVWLNNQSTLSYPEEFEGNTRNVQLEGRAFFDVSSNPSQPFLVQTSELVIRVLGTSFDISAYKNDRDMTVTVASGSVSVSGPAENYASEELSLNTLQPGEQLMYDRQNRQYVRQTMALGDIRALREGRLVFQNLSLMNIVQALERRYDITVNFENASDKEQRLTFKPNSNDLDEVLQVLSLVSGLEYTLNKNKRKVVMRESEQ